MLAADINLVRCIRWVIEKEPSMRLTAEMVLALRVCLYIKSIRFLRMTTIMQLTKEIAEEHRNYTCTSLDVSADYMDDK